MTDTNTTRITVANQKGGAGKTTDVIHTGGALAARGHDVLLVDIDYHGELTCSLGYNDLYYDTDRTTLFDVLEFDQMESMNDIIVEHEEFDILPASEKLANNKNIQTLLEAPKSRERLEMTLDELEKDYDYIIVDTPPSLNVLTDNALVATGNVVIPVIPEKLNANSLQIFTKQLSSLEQAYGDINRLAIVCNRVEQNAEHRDTIEEIKSAYSLRVFEIPKRTDLSQSIGEGVSVFGFGKENQRVEDARDLFNEIASRLTEKGWLDRLFPDTYLIIPLTAGEETVYTTHEYLIAAHVAEPMYIGYYSALSHHGLTEHADPSAKPRHPRCPVPRHDSHRAEILRL
nr:AAA family ATPase [Haloquadratum walsbyi]